MSSKRSAPPAPSSKQKRKPYDREAAKEKTPNPRYSRRALGLFSTRQPALPASAVYEDTLSRKNYRDCLMITCKRYYPNIKPRHDFDIVYLSSGVFNEDDSEFYAYADKQLDLEMLVFSGGCSAKEIADGTAREKFYAQMAKVMEGPPCVAGIKPAPGENDVHIRPIPDSDYSLRLWGNHLEQTRQYCLDFVKTKTGEPVNSPFKYELWAVHKIDAPMVPFNPVRLYMLDEAAGTNPQHIGEGEDKFVLFEGTSCRLIRPGKRSIYFEIPIRPRPQQDEQAEDRIVFY